MIILFYIISLIVFIAVRDCFALLFFPIALAYNAMKKERGLSPTHPIYALAYVLGTVLLLYLTRYVWAQWDYSPGWLFPTIVAVNNSVMEAFDVHPLAPARAFGVVFGVVIYGLLQLF